MHREGRKPRFTSCAAMAAAVMLSSILAAVPSRAESSSNSRCYWEQGVFVCTSKVETDRSVSTTICGSGGIDAACSTKTVEKELPPQKQIYYNETVRTFATRPAGARAETGLQPRGTALRVDPRPVPLTRASE